METMQTDYLSRCKNIKSQNPTNSTPDFDFFKRNELFVSTSLHPPHNSRMYLRAENTTMPPSIPSAGTKNGILIPTVQRSVFTPLESECATGY
jgi:hypothetical protein